MTVKSKPVVTLSTPSDRELVITAVVVAPRRLVWEASTKPEHVKRWWGPRRFTMTVCEIDLRPGGAWRLCLAGQRYRTRRWLVGRLPRDRGTRARRLYRGLGGHAR